MLFRFQLQDCRLSIPEKHAGISLWAKLFRRFEALQTTRLATTNRQSFLPWAGLAPRQFSCRHWLHDGRRTRTAWVQIPNSLRRAWHLHRTARGGRGCVPVLGHRGAEVPCQNAGWWPLWSCLGSNNALRSHLRRRQWRRSPWFWSCRCSAVRHNNCPIPHGGWTP